MVASPASFNNRAGLARAVNEHLADGTEVFVAEMGTYGPGEIAELCSWIPPDVAVITAIGPVHLERFGSADACCRPRPRSSRRARCGILVEDDPRLATLADELAARRGDDTIGSSRVSATRPGADVCVLEDGEGLSLLVRGAQVGRTGPWRRAPATWPPPWRWRSSWVCPPPSCRSVWRLFPWRRTAWSRPPSDGGVVVLDDTYNANPAGAAAALARPRPARRTGASARAW